MEAIKTSKLEGTTFMENNPQDLSFLGKSLKKYRTVNHLTQNKLADMLGCEATVVCTLENLSPSDCANLASVLNLTRPWGIELKEARTALGIKQTGLALLVNMSQPHVSGLERLDANTIDNALALLQAPVRKDARVTKIIDNPWFAGSFGNKRPYNPRFIEVTVRCVTGS